MSVQAPTRPELVGGDDGSGDEQDWRHWNAEVDGTEEFIIEDLGRLAILAGREKLPGLAKDFATDRIAVTRMGLPTSLGRLSMPYYFKN